MYFLQSCSNELSMNNSGLFYDQKYSTKTAAADRVNDYISEFKRCYGSDVITDALFIGSVICCHYLVVFMLRSSKSCQYM